jgi:hypothetical protein
MGELNRRKKTALAQASQESVAVQTMGGRMHVRWDPTAQATPHGQIVYFAELLATAGIFDIAGSRGALVTAVFRLFS